MIRVPMPLSIALAGCLTAAGLLLPGCRAGAGGWLGDLPAAGLAGGVTPPAEAAPDETAGEPLADDGSCPSPVVVPASFDESVAAPPAEISADPPEVLGAAPLTLASFEEIALSRSPAVAEAAADVQAAYGNWIQVGLPPNPELGYSGQQLGSRGLAEQQGVFIGQEIVLGRKLWLSRNVASWEMQRAERSLTIQQLRVLTDVRVAYCDVIIAQRRKQLAGQLVEVGDQAARAAESLYQAKEVSEADPLRARIEADTARIVWNNAVNQHLAAWRTLAAVAGVADMLPVDLPTEFEPEPVAGEWEELLAQLLVDSPEIAARQASVEAAHWAVHRAWVENVPNLDVQAIIQRDNATQSSNGSLQVAMPIPVLNRNQGRIQQARAQLAAAQLSVDRLSLDLQSRFADTYQRYANARHQVDRYTASGGILDSARRSMELIRSGYEAGEFSVLDLLTAQRVYFQTNLDYLGSLRELWIASMEIQGMLLRGSLRAE